jgi:DNA-directed RNA polymerase
MEDEIRAIAINPLLNLSSWAQTDSPFEFLAFCFAYSDYLNDNNALIHIPVALDAVCSGIQIYSGLLLDGVGAEAVNVINKYEVVDVPDDYQLLDGEEFVE